MEAEGEGRTGEVEACWQAGPGRLEVGEVGEDQREEQVEAEGEGKQGKKVGACCCERGREGQRTRERADGRRRFLAPSSCEAQSLLIWAGSTAASGRLRSSNASLGSCLLSLFDL